jgi:hypothetical protein
MQKAEIIESDEYDASDADIPYPVLTPPTPVSKLPGKKITDYLLTDRIDTLNLGHVWDSTSNPRAYTYQPAAREFGHSVAIQRQHDWVILDWSLFTPFSPAGMKMKWIDLDGQGSLELMFIRDGGVQQITSSVTSPLTGTKYRKKSNWDRATGFCIIDIDKLTFIVESSYTGYEYYFELSKYILGPENHSINGSSDSYYTDRQRKTFTVFYDFKVMEGKGMIEVRQVACKQSLIFDPSKEYVIKTTSEEPSREKIEYEKSKCIPMYEEGVYGLEDGQLIRRN